MPLRGGGRCRGAAGDGILGTTTGTVPPGATTDMTAPDRTYDRVRFHRGSRGFAAFITGLNASILLGLALFATPTFELDRTAASWFVILVGGAGLGHAAAVVGLVRGRAWS